MKDRIAIGLIENMIEQSLQLGWDHLQNGNCDLALHEFHSACEKVGEIRELLTGQSKSVGRIKRVNASTTQAQSNDQHSRPESDSSCSVHEGDDRSPRET